MSPAPTPGPARDRAPRWLIGLFLVVLVTAGAAFLFKLVEFARTLRDAPDVSFTFMPIVTYLVVAGGFFCLLGWALLGGHLRDVEGPKHFMLENERALDAAAARREEGLIPWPGGPKPARTAVSPSRGRPARSTRTAASAARWRRRSRAAAA